MCCSLEWMRLAEARMSVKATLASTSVPASSAASRASRASRSALAITSFGSRTSRSSVMTLAVQRAMRLSRHTV